MPNLHRGAEGVYCALVSLDSAYCNITCLTGKDLRTALSGYLDVLAGQNPEAVGGKVPSDDFYYEFDPEA